MTSQQHTVYDQLLSILELPEEAGWGGIFKEIRRIKTPLYLKIWYKLKRLKKSKSGL